MRRAFFISPAWPPSSWAGPDRWPSTDCGPAAERNDPRTMTESGITLRSVDGDRAAFMPLLLEADDDQA